MEKGTKTTFEQVLEEQPDISVKVNEHEMKGNAIVALVETEEGQIGMVIGGAFNIKTMIAMLEAMDDAKDKLIEQLAHASIENLFKELSSHGKMKH